MVNIWFKRAKFQTNKKGTRIVSRTGKCRAQQVCIRHNDRLAKSMPRGKLQYTAFFFLVEIVHVQFPGQKKETHIPEHADAIVVCPGHHKTGQRLHPPWQREGIHLNRDITSTSREKQHPSHKRDDSDYNHVLPATGGRTEPDYRETETRKSTWPSRSTSPWLSLSRAYSSCCVSP